ncbi:MAG: cytidylyltransferase domain-containing protein [Methylophilaceae bacterium]
MNKKISIIIPAKGNSERLKNKNLCEINGKSLIQAACEKVLKCKYIDNVYLDTESEFIINQVDHLTKKGLKIIKRPNELANNDIGANEMMVYGLHSIDECDILLQTFATSPTITHQTIDDCIEKFIDNIDFYDSFFTVSELQEYFWEEDRPMNFNPQKVPNSYELDKIFMETHGLYGIKTESLIKNKTRVGLKPLKIKIPKIESFDVNDYSDLKIVERILS